MAGKTPVKGRLKSTFKIYYNETRRHPWLFWGALIGTIGMQAGDLIGPLFLRQFFNLIAGGNSSPEVIQQLVQIIGFIALVSFSGWLFRRINSFSVMWLELGVMSRLYEKTFDYLLRHSNNFFINQFAGTLTRRVSKYVYAYEQIMDSILLRFFPSLLFIVGAVTVLAIRNRTLGLILGCWIIFFIAFQIYITRLRQPLRIASAEEDSRLTGALADSISNQNTIALFSGMAGENLRFRNVVEAWRKITEKSWNADEVVWAIQGLLFIGINVGILYVALKYWRVGLLTIGDFALIQAYLIGTIERLIANHGEIRRFFRALADAKEMADILEEPYEIQDVPRAKELSVWAGEINFIDVDFHFNEDNPVLKKLNIKIKGGEKVALVGPSGAGKSTVTKLLLRLYDVNKGSLEIDGQNVAQVTQESLRNAIAFVPQEPILFHRSLIENIRYGRRGATDVEVMEAAKKAHCHEFILSLPDKYNTFVGERGVKLSGGERQRVAIARAILKNSPILILDEATSSLDSASEYLIQDALATLMKGKTVVVIAHRLSTIIKMDRIVVLDEGKITAEGTHAELLEQKGLYQKLWSIQAGGFLTDDHLEEKKEDEDQKEDLIGEEKERVFP